MWRPRIPRGDPDGLYAVTLVAVIPAIFLILNGVGVIETLVTAVLVGAVIYIAR